MEVRIQFINHPTEKKSEVLGPFDFVQLTYETLRVATNGKTDVALEIAFFDPSKQRWEYEGQSWTDVCMF